jgi:hypothetical protein
VIEILNTFGLFNGNKNGNGTDISVEVLLKRLEQLGIKIDLEKIRSMK